MVFKENVFVSTLFATLLDSHKNYRYLIVMVNSSANLLFAVIKYHHLLSKVESINGKSCFNQNSNSNPLHLLNENQSKEVQTGNKYSNNLKFKKF